MFVLDGLKQKDWESTVAVLPDHPTPIANGNHTREPVPVAIRSPQISGDGVECFDEESVRSGSLGLLSGSQFIETFLNMKM